MKSIVELIGFLKEYNDLWKSFYYHNYEHPIDNVSGAYLNKDNCCYNYFNFSGDNSIYQLFNTNNPMLFIGLCFPKNNPNLNYDECPIYVFDSDAETFDESYKLIGNFKTLITDALKYLIKVLNEDNFDHENHEDENDRNIRVKAHQCLERMKDFSNVLIEYRYQMKPGSNYREYDPWR